MLLLHMAGETALSRILLVWKSRKIIAFEKAAVM
jgi:hypothetical protein